MRGCSRPDQAPDFAIVQTGDALIKRYLEMLLKSLAHVLGDLVILFLGLRRVEVPKNPMQHAGIVD